MNANQNSTKILRLTESSLMIAFAAVLSEIHLFAMPMGGNVTVMSMLPIAIIAYRYGTKWGLLTGFAYGALQMVIGLDNLRYSSSIWAVICIILFDYIVAYTFLGIVGFFREKFGGRQSAELSVGIVAAGIIRFICHFISGWAVWSAWAPEGMSAWLYSLTYNAYYMVPEILITIIGGAVVSTFLNFKDPDITRKKTDSNKHNSPAAFILKMVGVLAVLSGVLYTACALIYPLTSEDTVTPSFSSLLPVLLPCVLGGVLLYGIGEFIHRKVLKTSQKP